MTDAVAIVVLAYDGIEAARRVLDELGDLADEAPAVIVHNPGRQVIDETTTDPRCRILWLPHNIGYGAAMNAGMAAVTDDAPTFVLLLTQDAAIARHDVERLVAAAAADPGLGVVGPVLRDPSLGVVFSAGGFRDTAAGIGHRVDLPQDEVAPCDWIDGAVMLLRCRMIEQIGPIDERFFLYFEENDYARRARAAGWGVAVVTSSTATQIAGSTQRPGAFTYLMTRNELELRRRALGARAVLSWLGAVLLQSLKEAVVLALRRSTAERRAEIRVVLPAKVLGVFHFARRRFGPPPRWLPGLGDVVV